MKQTNKALINLGVLVVVGLAIAFAAAWVGRDEERKSEGKEQSAKVFALEKSKLRELELKKGGKLVAHLKRDAQNVPWKLTVPVQGDADEAVLGLLADKIESLKQKGEVEGVEPKGVGLGDEAKAALSVTTVDDAGKSQTVLFGDLNPFDQSLYVKRTGEKGLRLIAAADKAPFDKELFDLRDKRVAHLDEAAEVQKIAVQPAPAKKAAKGAPAEPEALAFTIAHEGPNWKLLAPVEAPADGGTGERVIAAVRQLKAMRIASDGARGAGLALYGLEAPLFTVTLTVLPPGSKETLLRQVFIGQPTLERSGSVVVKTYARREDSALVFEVDPQIVKDLTKTLFDLQDKAMLRFDREAVRKVDFKGGGKEAFTVTRKKEAKADGGLAEEKFEVIAPTQAPARLWKVSGNLYSLSGLKAAAFGGAVPKDAKGKAKVGLDDPRTVTLLGEGDAVLARILVGAATGEGTKRRWVSVEGSPLLYEVDDSALSDLPARLDDVLEPPPAPPPPPAPADAGAPAAPPSGK
jgi:Domain of unknown function (DUF4340)